MSTLFTAFATNPTGTNCLLGNGPIACAGKLPSLVVIVPCNHVCPDEIACTHKMIMFDDNVRAVLVRCFVELDVTHVQKMSLEGSVTCVVLTEMPKDVAAVVTCPPPATRTGAVVEMTPDQKLTFLTDWAHQQNFKPATTGPTGMMAETEPTARLRTEDGELGSLVSDEASEKLA
jgi:hypothetical protein